MAALDSPSARARTLCLRPQPRAHEESASYSTRPRLESAPGPTRPRPLPYLRAQRGRAFTSGRMYPTAWATRVRLQSFPVGGPSSHVRPQLYINPLAPPHKSLVLEHPGLQLYL
jgi:hypothetical protein